MRQGLLDVTGRLFGLVHTAFDAEDLFAPGVAHRYRDTVLAAGGSRDAADLVETLLGRPYDNRAFTAWLETAPGEAS